jgi:phosphoglycerol transferase
VRIALQNAFPDSPNTAEAEWIRRCHTACERLGFTAVEVVTSDDILAVAPDCVLATHHFTAKITPVPTIGLMWNAPAYFAGDAAAHKAILSYDGHICGSQRIAQWVDDFFAGCGKEAVIHDRLLLPSSPELETPPRLPDQLRIMYAGIHWDGSRHGAIFRDLAARVPMDIYGPPEAWRGQGASYRGSLPFDGTSVISAIGRAGVALCLHKGEHRAWNCPSMRLFEAASAGALIITDDFEFPREWFRNAVLYVNPDLPGAEVVQQVVDHLEWAGANLEGAQALADRSNQLFRRRLSLEHMLASLPDFVGRVRERRGMVPVRSHAGAAPPTVEYVVRVGLRPAEMLVRALESLAAQTWPSISVILVEFHPVEGLEQVIEHFADRFAEIRHVIVHNDGNRATTLWAGVGSVRADYFGVLDDDDTLHPNHVASVMACLAVDRDCGFAYSGLVRVHDDEGHFFESRRDSTSRAPVVSRERRQLFALDQEDFVELQPTRNVIGIHAWIAKRALLDARLLTNPRLDLAEDVFLMASLVSRTKPAFTGSATAEWRLRATQRDNWTLSHPAEEADIMYRRWYTRAQTLGFLHRNRPPRPGGGQEFHDAVSRDVS